MAATSDSSSCTEPSTMWVWEVIRGRRESVQEDLRPLSRSRYGGLMGACEGWGSPRTPSTPAPQRLSTRGSASTGSRVRLRAAPRTSCDASGFESSRRPRVSGAPTSRPSCSTGSSSVRAAGGVWQALLIGFAGASVAGARCPSTAPAGSVGQPALAVPLSRSPRRARHDARLDARHRQWPVDRQDTHLRTGPGDTSPAVGQH